MYFQCAKSFTAGDAGPPVHYHQNESEGIYILSGTLTLTVGGISHVLSQGEYLLIERGELHTWSNEGGEAVEAIVTYSPAGIEEMFKELDANPAGYKEIAGRYGMTIVE